MVEFLWGEGVESCHPCDPQIALLSETSFHLKKGETGKAEQAPPKIVKWMRLIGIEEVGNFCFMFLKRRHEV